MMTKVNKEKQAAVPQKVLHELFDYNSETGKWANKINRGARARKGQPAGCLKKDGYNQIMINGHSYYTRRLAWAYVYGDFPEGGQPLIDHINGNPSDNRIANLKISSHSENMKNQKMQSNNTSGVNGVYRQEIVSSSGKIYHYWIAQWYDENGKFRYKYFSITKLGENQAKQTAIDYREGQLRLLELNFGIVYSERHGT